MHFQSCKIKTFILNARQVLHIRQSPNSHSHHNHIFFSCEKIHRINYNPIYFTSKALYLHSWTHTNVHYYNLINVVKIVTKNQNCNGSVFLLFYRLICMFFSKQIITQLYYFSRHYTCYTFPFIHQSKTLPLHIFVYTASTLAVEKSLSMVKSRWSTFLVFNLQCIMSLKPESGRRLRFSIFFVVSCAKDTQ